MLRRRQLDLAKNQKNIERQLPHLYGRKFYQWAREFFDSDNRVNLLCAANQISKSSTAIRRCIADATDEERWQRLWGKDVRPKQFWYFYPDSNTLQREWHTKWQEWMPNGEMQSDIKYGWSVSMEKNTPKFIEFKSGVVVFFQFYTKKAANVQSSTVHEIFVDEELPIEFYDELMFRLTNTNGIFNAVFTPTLNQEFWRKAMTSDKVLEGANKQTVSMYDCLHYEDGTPGHFSKEQIKLIIAKCKNDTEIQRRVFGQFVTEKGRTFYAFDIDRHHKRPMLMQGWNAYCAVDYGSGGTKGHPAAIVFIAVEPGNRQGRVIKVWRGDGQDTTAGDVFNKYQEMKEDLPQKLPLVLSSYDPASRDFAVIAERNGVTFIKADKHKDIGEETVNTLFKNDMLMIDDNDNEDAKLCGELMHLMRENTSSKNKYGDDLCDALRYACLLVSWDFSVVEDRAKERAGVVKNVIQNITETELIAKQIEDRRGDRGRKEEKPDEWQELEDEMEYWNEQYG
jgi:phage terminase large subunit-like protein